MSPDLDCIQQDPLLRYARWSLVFCGTMYVLLGLGFSGLFILMPLLEPQKGFPLLFGAVLGFFALLLCAGLGVVNFLVARDLARGRKWAWIGGLILGALYAPSICLPFGVLILYALLRESIRRAFEA